MLQLFRRFKSDILDSLDNPEKSHGVFGGLPDRYMYFKNSTSSLEFVRDDTVSAGLSTVQFNQYHVDIDPEGLLPPSARATGWHQAGVLVLRQPRHSAEQAPRFRLECKRSPGKGIN